MVPGSAQVLNSIHTLPPSLTAPAAQQSAARAQRKCQFTAEGQALSVSVARTAAELAEHVAAWDELARQTIEPNVFYESWMLLPALATFGVGVDLRFVLVYTTGPSNEGCKPILCGFFPLAAGRGYKGLPIEYSSFWRYKYCSLCTPLIRPEYASDCVAVFFNWLASAPEAGAFLEMGYISGEGLFNQLLTQYFNESRNLLLVEEQFNRALLERWDDGESYLNTALSGKRRKELRRQQKLLRELGAVEYAELTTGGEIEDWLEQFLQLETKGWKGEEGSALAADAAAREFFGRTMRSASQRGQLMMLALRLNGQPIALKCNLLSGAGSFAFKIAFDEAFGSYSPGVHLELENIRRLHEHTELAWMDSCATARHFMINRLWLSRRTIKTILASTGKSGGNLLLASLPLLRWFKRKFSYHPANSTQ